MTDQATVQTEATDFVFKSKLDQAVIDKMTELQPLDWDLCGVIADEFGLKQRTVQTTATRLGLEYKRKERATKTGEAVISKADLVAQFAEAVGLDADWFDGMDKATKQSLQRAVDAVKGQTNQPSLLNEAGLFCAWFN